MKLKICGLKRLQDVDYVNQANIEFTGLVFAPSRQQITAEFAKELKAALNPNIKAVGVFVNESYEFIKSLVDDNIIDIAQFHGDVEYDLPIPTIRAFRMRTAEDIIPTNCDYVLFDSYKEGTRGSTGGMFDWRLIDEYARMGMRVRETSRSPARRTLMTDVNLNIKKPFFLAGGINITNIKQAMKLNPYCIDISSGAEDENGDKSLDKILELKDVLTNG